MKTKVFLSVAIILIALLLSAGCVGSTDTVDTEPSAEGSYRTVVDSRGVAVQVPVHIERVVTVSDGMIEGTMTYLGVEETIVGVGSSCIQRIFHYEFPTIHGESYWYRDGMNPVTYLNPWIIDIPRVAESGAALNYESLVTLDPDVVILRVGSCTVRHISDESVTKTIHTIESLGIPLIVIYGPPAYTDPDLTKMTDEILIIGEVFGKKDEASTLAAYLEDQVSFIYERTKDIPMEERPRVLVLGLSPRARDAGGAGQVFGLDTIESYFIEEIAHAKNAYRQDGYFKTVSAEHILSIDPDVIVLCTASGYHPPSELYTAPYYQNLQELTAVKNQRVVAWPWTPCNCAKRIEYPIDVMIIAKAAYPDLFADIELSEWLLDFYKNVYDVDHQTAIGLRSAQWMDWAVDDCPSCG
ncbi:MAG: iron ABC transporter substrate-binding protein [Methanocalculus sp. MSAO_Arc1]|uniref:ABC transporter substrate-binding protein n=1 Tax=Methanocalculus TaxID=71151 RepID=UPI000FF67DBC|nr:MULTISPECIES: ABC transporter substrate-binding protein [unclassified Methanocalculus]MCP1661524.1 iron complex transport system substrate-binding protein [Methanocalculus sp. AMF5]RQD81008.1 MAG: iron ABC transporter substrate-binding protein [Methanocalculus sp. MSAO_Arc1]